MMFDRFRWFLTGKSRERDMRRELEADLEAEVEERIEAGMSSEDAEFAARRAFGNTARVREDLRDFWRFPILDSLILDLKFAFRQLRSTPGFAFIAVFTLALGIGANTAVFSVVDTLLLYRPPFEHIDRLVTFSDVNPEALPPDMDGIPSSPGNFIDWRDQAGSFDGMTVWQTWFFTLSDPDAGVAPELVRGVRVSPSFFEMIGVRPRIGRTFRPEEGEPGRDPVVLLTDSLWKRRFAADARIVGKTARIEGRPMTVIGVLPEDFEFYQQGLDLWIPWSVNRETGDRETHSILVHGRLAPGVSIEEAQAEMDGIAARLETAYPETNRGWGVRLKPLFRDTEVEAMRSTLYLLLGASSLVLLIACANVANLLLFRAAARRREIAIRGALGATRPRLVFQMLTESLLLAISGAALALPLAFAGAELLIPRLPHNSWNQSIGAWRFAPGVDLTMLGFSLTVAFLSVLFFGLLPAFQTTKTRSLRVHGADIGRQRLGRLLTGGEIALAIMLLVGATLLLESFWRLQRVDPGFRTDHLLTMQVWLPQGEYPDPSDISGFYDETLRGIRGLSGVEAAGAVSYMPFNGVSVAATIEVEGRIPENPSDAQLFIPYRVVTPGYIELLEQPLLAGRDFTGADGPESRGVAIINQTMARRFWPDDDPIGKRIRPGFFETQIPWLVSSEPRWLTVVGVVDDIREFRLDRPADPTFYVPYRQFPSAFSYLMVRTTVAPESLRSDVEGQVRAMDPGLPVSNVRSMDEAMTVILPRFNVQLFGAFGTIAVVLAAVGVYGVTSYSVRRRRQEIAIRMALGARPGTVVAMIVREGVAQAAMGVAVGLLGAYILSRGMTSLLYEVTATDTSAFMSAPAVLFLVALAACYVPARRAAGVSPSRALAVD